MKLPQYFYKKKEVSSNCKIVHGHSFPSISPKRSKQLVYVNINLQKILKVANSFKSKYKIPKGANSYGEQTLSLKNRKTTILNSQSIRMLQTHVNSDIYNKYRLIHNNSWISWFIHMFSICVIQVQSFISVSWKFELLGVA